MTILPTTGKLLPLAIHALGHPDEGMRLLARQRIFEMGNAGLAALKHIAMDEGNPVALEAAHVLCEGDTEHHIEILRILTLSRNEAVSQLATDYLENHHT